MTTRECIAVLRREAKMLEPQMFDDGGDVTIADATHRRRECAASLRHAADVLERLEDDRLADSVWNEETMPWEAIDAYRDRVRGKP